MKNIYLALAAIIVSGSVSATLRTDVPGRTKEQAYEISNYLGNAQELSSASCLIEVEGPTYSIFHATPAGQATGIALDPYTILTCANLFQLCNIHKITVNFQPVASISSARAIKVTQRPILHPRFKLNPNLRTFDIYGRPNGKIYCFDIELPEWAHFDFDRYNQLVDPHIYVPFNGPDLAILKLDEPLTGVVNYPDILSAEKNIKDVHGRLLSYGLQKYNDQEKGPTLYAGESNGSKRHLMSVKVSNGERGSEKVFYAKYKGLIVNGDESFIPDADMLTIAGLPSGGDAGGALLIRDGEDQKLAGIFSGTWSLRMAFIDRDQDAYRVLKDFVQPLFTTWTDIRHYKDWIESNMGPLKK